MLLEEYTNYKTVKGKQVNTMRYIEISIWYDYEILKILQKTKEEFDEQQKILETQHLLSWLVDDHRVPSATRHAESGKCLSFNSWGNRALKLEDFDIDITDHPEKNG